MEIAYAILCEGVRREDNGKLFAYGIYGNSILLPSFPAQLELCLLVRIFPKGPGEFPLNFRIRLGGDELGGFNGRVKSEDGTPETTTTPLVQIPVPGPGTLEFVASENDTDWTTVFSIPVSQNPNI